MSLKDDQKGRLYPWQVKEREKLEDAGKNSAYSLIIICILGAAGLVVGGVVRLISFFRSL